MENNTKQTISIPKGISLYVGAVLGSGILILPGITGGIAGTNAILSWIIMVILSIPLAYTFAFLSIEYPSAGGISTFATQAFGRYAGVISGWFFFVAGSFGQIIVSLTGGVYISFAFNLPYFASYLIALFLLILAIIGNYFGLQTSSKIQLIIASLTFFILVSTIILSIPHIQFHQLKWSLTEQDIVPIGQSMMLIFWSFFGWEAISSLAPEFKKPRKRNILWSTWGAIIITGVIYIGISLAVIGTQSYIFGTSEVAEATNNASLAAVIKKVMGTNAAWIIGILAFTICLGTINAFLASISRLGYSLAHNKSAPKWLDYYDEKRSTPTCAVLLVGLIAIFGLAFSYIFSISLEKLVFIPNSLAIATYIVGTASGIKLLSSMIGKIAACISCLLCLIAYPFIGASITLPIGLFITCLIYITWRDKKEKHS
jgi:amino acid efflux transporter